MLRPFFLIFCCVFCNYLLAQQRTTSNPPHPLIGLQGYFIAEENLLWATYSGSNLQCTVKGNSAAFVIQGFQHRADQPDFIGIELNGKFIKKIPIQNSIDTLILDSLLNDTVHRIRLIKLTEAMVGRIAFKSIQLGPNTTLLAPRNHHRQILWIGNSLTCGYGNEVTIPAPPLGNPSTGFHSNNENNYYSWSSVTSRTVEASSIQICWSGKGVYRNFDGSNSSTMVELTQKESIIEHNPWDPDLILINLGTNDFGPELLGPGKEVDSVLFVGNYIKLIHRLRKNYPQAKILVTLGTALSDYFPPKTYRLSRCRTYLKSAITASEMENISFFELEVQHAPYGEDWHPTIETHRKMSEQITTEIRRIMNW